MTDTELVKKIVELMAELIARRMKFSGFSKMFRLIQLQRFNEFLKQEVQNG